MRNELLAVTTAAEDAEADSPKNQSRESDEKKMGEMSSGREAYWTQRKMTQLQKRRRQRRRRSTCCWTSCHRRGFRFLVIKANSLTFRRDRTAQNRFCLPQGISSPFWVELAGEVVVPSAAAIYQPNLVLKKQRSGLVKEGGRTTYSPSSGPLGVGRVSVVGEPEREEGFSRVRRGEKKEKERYWRK